MEGDTNKEWGTNQGVKNQEGDKDQKGDENQEGDKIKEGDKNQGEKNHATSLRQQQKKTQPLGTEKTTQASRDQKKSCILSGQK